MVEASIGAFCNCFGAIAMCYILYSLLIGCCWGPAPGTARSVVEFPPGQCRCLIRLASTPDAAPKGRGRAAPGPSPPILQAKKFHLPEPVSKAQAFAGRSFRRLPSVRHSKASGCCPSCFAPSRSRVTPNLPPSRRKPFHSSFPDATCSEPHRRAPARPPDSRCPCCNGWRRWRRRASRRLCTRCAASSSRPRASSRSRCTTA